MKLFTLEPRFDSRTGQPTAPRLIASGWLCDFCGAEHSNDSDDAIVAYEISEVGDSEPMFGTIRVPGFPDLSPYDFFGGKNKELQFCSDFMTNKLCEHDLLIAAVEGKLGRIDMICLVMYQARANMLAKALKIYSLAQLGLEE